MVYFPPTKARPGDANDGQRLLTNHQHPSEHSGVEAEAAAPEVVAQDDNRVSVWDAVVLVGKQAAHGRSYSEHLEVIAGDKLPLNKLHSLAAPRAEAVQRSAARQHASEQFFAFAKLKIERVRETIAAAPTARLVQGHEFRGLLDGQRSQRERVEKREHRGVGADAESQRQHCRDCETWIPAQAAGAIAQVFRHDFEPGNAPPFTVCLRCLRDAAKLPQRGVAGLLGGHAAPKIRFDLHFEVGPQLFIQLPVEVAGGEQGAHAGDEHAMPGHGHSPIRRRSADAT